MTAPDGARDALEGPCADASCTWWPWPELEPCPDCGKALCADHVEAHHCVEDDQ